MPQVNLRLPDELLAEVDRARGAVARERWIRDAIRQRLNGGAPPAPAAARGSADAKRDVRPIPKRH